MSKDRSIVIEKKLTVAGVTSPYKTSEAEDEEVDGNRPTDNSELRFGQKSRWDSLDILLANTQIFGDDSNGRHECTTRKD